MSYGSQEVVILILGIPVLVLLCLVVFAIVARRAAVKPMEPPHRGRDGADGGPHKRD